MDNLTNREAEVLDLLASGKLNREIACQLGVTHHTVEQHLKSIYRKLNVSNRVQACAIYWQVCGKITDSRNGNKTEQL